jgi:hypothetical protein
MSGAELNSLLDSAESHFIARRFAEALDQSLRTLQLLMGYPSPEPTVTVAALHLPASGLIDHHCSSGCVCEAAVLLALQAIRENDAPLSEGDLLLSLCYPILKLCPYDVFCAWFAYSCETADPSRCDSSIQRALEYWDDDKTALLPRPRLTVQQRQSLLLQIVFNGMFYTDIGDVESVELNATIAQQCKRAHAIIDACSEWASEDFSASLRRKIEAIAARNSKSIETSTTTPVQVPDSSPATSTALASVQPSQPALSSDSPTGTVPSVYRALLARIQQLLDLVSQFVRGPNKSRARVLQALIIAFASFISWRALKSILSVFQTSDNAFIRLVRNQLATSWQLAFGSFGRYM